MDIKRVILEKLRKNGRVKASEIVKLTGFSRAYTNRFFQQLRDEGMIVMLGKSNRAHYVLARAETVLAARKKILRDHSILRVKGLQEDIVLNNIKSKTGIFMGISSNISNIVSYAFTEMLNNAIEHSRSEAIEISIEREKENIFFRVIDSGVGIYNNIMQKKHLHDQLEAIQDLIKGKLTTAPEAHSGEGIFFTSKVADLLIIQSSRKKLVFDNLLDDIFIKDISDITGTKIQFSISLDSKRSLNNIFRQYTDDSSEFSKTRVVVKLYKNGLEYISRSQARRIVSGLDKFKTVVLDFKGIETVGQGFADEVFRVWKSRFPQIDITYKNANENVCFMIKRAVAHTGST